MDPDGRRLREGVEENTVGRKVGFRSPERETGDESVRVGVGLAKTPDESPSLLLPFG